MALVVVTGCGGEGGTESSVGPPVSVPASTEVPSGSTGSVEPVATPGLTEQAVSVRDGAAGGVLLSITRADGTMEFGSDGPDGSGPGPSTPIRVGSVTKILVAVSTLQLVDEGELSLDDPASDHLTRLSVPDEVTIRHLLENRSGLVDFVELAPDLVADPSRVWSPEEVMAGALDQELSFDPGSAFEYSNTNYLVLGVLVEELTGRTLDEALAAGISDPMGMDHTFLGGPDEPAGVMPSSGQGDTPYTAIATAAWAAGGLVSTAFDLHRFMTGLFSGDLISDGSLEEMTADPNGDGYGLGIYLEGDDRYGHGGGVPGYRVQLTHDTRTGATVFVATNDDSIDFAPVLGSLYDEARDG